MFIVDRTQLEGGGAYDASPELLTEASSTKRQEDQGEECVENGCSSINNACTRLCMYMNE